MLEEQPKCTFMCGHMFHTRCILLSLYDVNLEFYRCRDCEENVFTPDIMHDAMPVEEATTITTELQVTEAFQNDIKRIITIHKESVKAKNALIKKSKETIAEFNRVVKPQLTILKNYKKTTFANIKAMEEYKNAIKSFGKYNRFLTTLCRNHNLNQHDVRMYLRTNLRIQMHWRYYNIKWMIMRKLKTRIGI